MIPSGAEAAPRDARAALAVALGVLAPAALVPALAAVAFALGRPVGPWIFPIALALALALSAYGVRHRRRTALACAAAVLATWTLAAAAAGAVTDVSFDGLWYHAVGALDLARGWNPFREPADPFHPGEIYVPAYPKGAWILRAALLRLGLPFEATKAANLALLVAAFAAAFAAARVHAPGGRRGATAIALAATLCPIATAQLATAYVDGQLASTLTVLAAALVVSTEPALRAPALLGAALALAHAVALKFTGPVYVGIGVLSYGLAGVLLRRRAVAVAASGLAAVALVAFVAVGFSPYVTNLRAHGHPFYPLAGRDRFEVIGNVEPRALVGRDPRVALLASIFSATTHGEPRPKIPFATSIREVDAMRDADTKIGGFGPWFGGAVLVATATVLLLLSGPASRRDRGLLVLAALVLTALPNPHAWWARYVPQLWLVPIVAAVLAWRAGRARLAWAGIGLALASALLATFVQLQAAALRTRDARRHLDEVARLAGPVRAQLGEFEGIALWLERRGIPFVRVDGPPGCANPLTFRVAGYAVCPAAPAASTATVP